MIDLYEPTRRGMSLRQMMDRLLEDAFIMPREGQVTAMETPLNVYEEGDHFIVEAQLPGIKPEDVDVTVEGDTLTIRGEMKQEEERKERNYMIREHRRGTFVRSVRLPETVDPDAVQATFENGILRLTFPKSEQAKPRRIRITGGSQGSTGGQQGTTSGSRTGAQGTQPGGNGSPSGRSGR